MKTLLSLQEASIHAAGGALTIGNFDGVHRGHAEIIRQVVTAAERADSPSAVLTFDPHPIRVLRPESAPPLLTTLSRRGELLAQLGVDFLVVIPCTLELLQLMPEEFFTSIVLDQLKARAIVEGVNFRFGKARQGTVEDVRRLANLAGIDVEIVSPLLHQEEPISSSRVRAALQEGKIAEVNAMLTQPYRLQGTVIHGAERGRTLGFPTANLGSPATLIPAEGVYAGRCDIAGTAWPVAINIGPNPTFGEEAKKVEVHLIGYEGDLYGQLLCVDFLERLRETQAFPSPQALAEQLARDVEAAKQAFDNHAAALPRGQ